MIRPAKSPNMMSTTGRIPVIPAPTPIPVKPASDLGVSSTRSVPNSWTRPPRTLNAVPASATSSPMMKTRGSRRISSASASRTASPKVNSRTASFTNSAVSGIHVLLHLVHVGIGRRHSELYGFLDLGLYFHLDLIQRGLIGDLLRENCLGRNLDRISLRLPLLLFLFRAIVFAADITHMVPHEAIGVRHKERGTIPVARALDQTLRHAINGAHILAIDAFRLHTERGAARQNIARSRFGNVGVLVVHVVLANVDHGQLP